MPRKGKTVNTQEPQQGSTPDSEKKKTAEELEKEQEEWFNIIENARKQINKNAVLLRVARLQSIVVSDPALQDAESIGPLSDAFFAKLSEDKEAIAEVISTVLGRSVEVRQSVPQRAIYNIGSRGVRLDDYAEVGLEATPAGDSEWGRNGAYVDIELQGQDNDDHVNRAYYNGASLLIDRTSPGTPFKDLPSVAVIYISDFDVLGENRVIDEVVRYSKYTGKPVKGPAREIYINLSALDKKETEMDQMEREVAAMGRLFKYRDAYDMERFPALSRRKWELLETEEGKMELGMACQAAFDALAKKNGEALVKANEKINALTTENASLATENASLATEKEALATKNATLSQQYKDATDTIERLRREIESLRH